MDFDGNDFGFENEQDDPKQISETYIFAQMGDKRIVKVFLNSGLIDTFVEMPTVCSTI